MLKTLGPTPSTAAKSTEYAANQQDPATIIYDGWRGSSKVTAICPPIQIFHPIFDDFTHIVNDLDTDLTTQDLTNIQKFMYEAGKICQSEPLHSENLCQLLGCILGITISVEPIIDWGKACQLDGIVTTEVCKTLTPYMILEVKQEIGDGGCDPTTQAGLYMSRSWIQEVVGYNHIHLDTIYDF